MESENTRTIEDDARVIRSMVEYYLSARNEYIKSLITLQGLLFTGLGFSWDKGYRLSLFLALIGIASTAAFYRLINISEKAIRELRTWWQSRLERDPTYNGPPVGSLPSNINIEGLGLGNPSYWLYAIFASAWGFMLGIVVGK